MNLFTIYLHIYPHIIHYNIIASRAVNTVMVRDVRMNKIWYFHCNTIMKADRNSNPMRVSADKANSSIVLVVFFFI